MLELDNPNHVGISFARVGDELRATVAPPLAIDLLDVGTVNGGFLEYTLTAADHGRSFIVGTDFSVRVEVPASLPVGFFASFSLTAFEVVEVVQTGTWASPARQGPAEFRTGPVGPVAFSVFVTSIEPYSSDPQLHVVGSGGERPNNLTVVYDSGWPASRPSADHVWAVGHTSAPSWLTAADVWLEDVS